MAISVVFIVSFFVSLFAENLPTTTDPNASTTADPNASTTADPNVSTTTDPDATTTTKIPDVWEENEKILLLNS